MPKITAYKRPGSKVKIEQTKVQREWMDITDIRHAYKCFPVTLANGIGYSISFTEDIEFIWDGILDGKPDHIEILKAPEHSCHTGRGNATISFNTEVMFRTDENLSMIGIVPPNYFIDGAVPFTSIISTSFYEYPFPAAWRVTRPNTKIVIPAGMPVTTVVPISLGELCSYELDLYDKPYDPEEGIKNELKQAAWNEKAKQGGGFAHFYRDAVDYTGKKMGEHEVKGISLKINDYTDEGQK